MTEAGFGMMSGAYFVGRKELLGWINEFLCLNYTKIEQTASAAVHCQLMDAIHPGKVPLSKVNFNATQEYEFVNNFKILQKIFSSVGVDKLIDVQALIRAKYQDNLEFCQWMKCYFDRYYKTEVPYDAEARRKEYGLTVSPKCGGKSPNPSAQTFVSKSASSRNVRQSVAPKPPANTVSSTPAKSATSVRGTKESAANTSETTTKSAVQRSSSRNVRQSVMPKSSTNTHDSSTTAITSSSSRSATSRQSMAVSSSSKASVAPSRPSVVSSRESKEYVPSTVLRNKNASQLKTPQVSMDKLLSQKDQKIASLEKQLQELSNTFDAMEQERNFYFDKLRKVEIFCQTHPQAETDPILVSVQEILYSTEEIPKVIPTSQTEETLEIENLESF